ncbi:MAG: AAA family ATPase [Gammaproteobacteria bacterium]|nr:AAA family ATPase [Gammaproteobacteria bacterium]
MIELLKATFTRLIAETKVTTYRYLYDTFHINNRLTGIIGPRGVGKTTLLLQYIKNNLYNSNQAFYFSADNIYFNTNSILEFVSDMHQTEGTTIFFIDEIHKYKNWSQELKNIYDSFPNLKVVFSGSSSIDLISGSYDLSRRATLFKLPGLSLREYINFTTGSKIKAITFTDLLADYRSNDNTLAQIPKIKGLFQEYLQHGYYPFWQEDPETFYDKLSRIIEKTIFEDIASHYNLKTVNLIYFKKIVNFLAAIPPGELNTHNLASNLGIDHKTTSHYLNILNDTGLATLLSPYVGGDNLLRKAEKIFLNNTTLLYTLNKYLGLNVNIGTARELFFIQMLSNAGIDTFYNKIGDFRTKDFIFEIGGKNKTNKQLQPAKLPAFLVKDNIMVSSNNIIPLYYFGFLY